LNCDGGGGASRRIEDISAGPELPWNGTRPVASSYSTTPNEKMSLDA
jgi:hypothetical protein